MYSWFEQISQLSDVAHGLLVDFPDRILNIFLVSTSILMLGLNTLISLSSDKASYSAEVQVFTGW